MKVVKVSCQIRKKYQNYYKNFSELILICLSKIKLPYCSNLENLLMSKLMNISYNHIINFKYLHYIIIDELRTNIINF